MKRTDELKIVEEIIKDHWLGLFASQCWIGPDTHKKWLKNHVYIYWKDPAIPELISFRVRFEKPQFINLEGDLLWMADPNFFEQAREIITEEFVRRIKKRTKVHKTVFHKWANLQGIKKLNKLIKENIKK